MLKFIDKHVCHQVKPTIEQYPVGSRFGFGWSQASATRQIDTQRETRKISIMISTTKGKSCPINVECCKGFKMENVSWIWTALRWQQDLYTKEGSRRTTDDRLLIPTQQQSKCCWGFEGADSARPDHTERKWWMISPTIKYWVSPPAWLSSGEAAQSSLRLRLSSVGLRNLKHSGAESREEMCKFGLVNNFHCRKKQNKNMSLQSVCESHCTRGLTNKIFVV